MTSREVDDLYSVLQSFSTYSVKVSIESAIGPGRIMMVALFKICTSIYVLKMCI